MLSDDWDYVTLQQVSRNSYNYSTYTPYVTALAEYIRETVPNAKLMLHQTWAYEQGSSTLDKQGYDDHHDMFNDIKSAYEQAAVTINADGIIPAGQAMINAVDAGIGSVHRDEFHADYNIGRYLIGITWYKALTGVDVENDFTGFESAPDQSKIDIARNVVKAIDMPYWTNQ